MGPNNMRIKSLTIICILILLLAACKIVEEIDVIVEQENVIFSFQQAIDEHNGMSADLLRLMVEKSGSPESPSSVYWMIESNSGAQKVILFDKDKAQARLRYGEILIGMDQIILAQPLTEGNYTVSGGFSIYRNGKKIRFYEFETSFKIE